MVNFLRICTTTALGLLLVLPAAAHNGAVITASVESPPIHIDGNLEDWPATIVAQPIHFTEYGTPPRDASDLDARLRVAWDKAAGALFVGIGVIDDDVVSQSGTTPWHAQDGCELYLDLEHAGQGSAARQHVLRGPWDETDAPGLTSAWALTEHGYACEWRLDLSGLDAVRGRKGRAMGFDVTVNDFDRDGSFSWTSWGAGVQKQSAAQRRGDLVIAGGEGVGELSIRTVRGGMSVPKVLLHVHSANGPALALTARTDANGTTQLQVPAGQYSISHSGSTVHAVQVRADDAASVLIEVPSPSPTMVIARGQRDRAGSGAREGQWHSFGQADGLAGGSVQVVHQAPDGAMWIGTQGGLSRYDGYWVTTFDAAAGLPSDNVLALASADDGLWIGTDAGLCRLSADSLACYDLDDGLPSRRVQALATDHTGRLWIGTPNGLALYDGQDMQILLAADGLPSHMVTGLKAQGTSMWVATFGGLARWTEGGFHVLSSADGLAGDAIYDIDTALDGSLWIAAVGGLSQLSAEGIRTFGPDDGLPSDQALAVLADSYGGIWVGTGTTVGFQAGSGMCHYRLGEFECFRVEDGLASNQVLNIFEDREGLVWAGTTAGVSRSGGAHFTHYDRSDGLGNDVVQTLLRTRDGTLWVGTENGLTRLSGDSLQTWNRTNGLPADEVWSLLEDRDGDLWIGTNAGLVRHQGRHFQRFQDGPGENLVLSLAQDQAGRIWIGTWTSGAYVYDGDTFTHLTPADGLGGVEVDAIVTDRQGRVWLGGWQAGVSVLDSAGDSLRTYSTADGLPSNTVHALGLDGEGRVWVGSDGGASMWTGDGFVSYSSVDGMAHNLVRTLLADHQGHMIFGTDAGVNLFDGLTFQSLLPRDGLRSNEIRALQSDGAGGLWIGSTRGLTHYHPRASTPTIQLVDVITDRHHGAQTQVHTTTDITLLGIEYQGISFKTRPEGMRYRYRLVGDDSVWVSTRANRVDFEDLPAGRYTFQVQAIDRDLGYASAPATVDLVVDLPIRAIIGWIAVAAVSLLAVILVIQTVRRNRVLAEASRAAREASDMKSQFLANMSHEIRTPMNGVVGMTELLQQTDLTTHQRSYLETISTSAESLLGIINDILDLSKIEAGRMSLEQAAFDLTEVVDGVMRMMAPRANDKQLELIYRLDPALPRGVVGDQVRLRQILVNLIGNALKFTEFGEVVVDLRADSVAGDVIVLHGSVRDSGIGISPEKMESIFSPFSQADASTTRHYGGTGLGLSICAELARIMEGRIWAESAESEGSTFHFEARLGLANDLPASTITPEQLTALEGMSVLVVDDSAANRQILEESLRGWQMSPVCVDGGLAALAALREAADAGRPFALGLLDAMMPAMDGLALVQHVHEDERLRSTALIMLSSLEDAGYMSQAREAGVQDVLRKPVTQSDLLTAILRTAMPSTRAQVSVVPVEDVPDVSPLSILLAEDNIVNQRVARHLLEGGGHTVDTVCDGQLALERMQSDGASYDVVLMDVQMPKMSGHEATRAIRQHEARTRSHVYIIGLTAHAMAGDREACMAAGMDDYVSKPVRRQALFQALARSVVRAGGTVADDTTAEKVEMPATATSATDDGPVIDLSVLGELEELEADTDFSVAEMIELFTEQGTAIIAEARAAHAAGDGETFTRAVHTLKGSARELGAHQLGDLAEAWEQIARAGDMTAAAEMFAPAATAHRIAVTALEDWHSRRRSPR